MKIDPTFKLYLLLAALLALHVSLLGQSKEYAGVCCCGAPTEMNFPGLDFEFSPDPPPGSFILYPSGSTFGPWTVTRATIDHVHATHAGLANGNPNGPSNFVDLHGSPGFGEISYQLTGLTPGNMYIIEFWYAQNGSGWTSTGTLRIAGGVWLNESWNVSTSGAVQWFKATYMFTARGANASMDFGSTGTNNFAGTLIDDIKIFECPVDLEKPEILNPPDDEMYFCTKEVPTFQNLLVSDNCDNNPKTLKSESRSDLDPCHYQLTRLWTITDACGNTTREMQLINVEDREGPIISQLPKNKIVFCNKNIQAEFNLWLNKNADAKATDQCDKVTWRNSYDRAPKNNCDSVLVEFIAVDHCGNETVETAYFIVSDTTKPNISTAAMSKQYSCIDYAKDSLRLWLSMNGFAVATDPCGTIQWSNNFSGDSTLQNITVTFYAKDSCGNIDSTTASFQYRNSSDTTRTTFFQCQKPVKAIDTLRFVQQACDSIVIIQYLQRPSDSVFLSRHTCDSLIKPFDTLILKNTFLCDSVIFTQHIFHPTPVTRIIRQDCAFDRYSIDTLNLTGQFCDSIVITEKIPLRKDSITLQLFTCDSLKAGLEFFSLKNIFGCDSLVTINTSFTSQQLTLLEKNECGLQVPYSDTLVFKTQQCDSIVVTSHLPAKIDSVVFQSNTCDPQLAGEFRVILKNQYGCDSIITQQVKLLPSDSIYLSQNTCIFSQAGIKRESLINRSGCDSIVITDIRFIPADSVYILNSSCDRAQVKKDTLVFKTSLCDSVVFFETIFKASDTSIIQSTTCDLQKSVTDTLRLINRNGCDSLVFRNIEYVQTKIKFDIDSILCHQQSNGAFNLQNMVDFDSPLQYFVNGALQNTSDLNRLGPGNYLIHIVDQSGCVSDTVGFTLYDPPLLQIDLGGSQEVSLNTKVRIDVTGNFNWQTIQWSPVNCAQCSFIEFNANDDQWIFAYAADQNGCSANDSVFIRVRKKVNIYTPNIFSPNGDNINERFYPQGDEGIDIQLLQIYDRWGEILFERLNPVINNPDHGWNGTFNGLPVLPGTYLYLIQWKTKDGEKKIIKGDISLMR